MQVAVSQRSFRDIEGHARAFEAKMDELLPGPSWPCKLATTKIGQRFSSRVYESSWLFCRWTSPSASNNAMQRWRFAERRALVSAIPSENSPQIVRLRTTDTTADWGENVPSLLKLTSGTTAAPRAIRFRSHQLLADCNQICDTMDISDDDLNFGVIPVSHSYGFSNLLTPLIARGVPMVVSRDRTPRAVLADLARTGATVFPGTPAFYQAFCDIGDVPPLPKLRLCISAGAPLSSAVAKKFFEKFNSRSIPSTAHRNAAEFATIATEQRSRMDLQASRCRVSKLSVSIQRSPPARFAFAALAVSDGYFPEPDDQKLGNGVFVPDDLLERHDSALKIVGRISDVINVAGKKVNPAEVEAHLLRFKGVRQAVVFGRPTGAGLRNEEVAACVLASPDVSESNLLRFCRTALSGWQVPKRIFIVDIIPTNERGKINRRDLARQFSKGHESSPLRTLAS